MIFSFFKKLAGKKGLLKAQRPVVEGESIGKITHFFSHSKAGVIKLQGPLSTGDTIRVVGHTTDFKQKISSMQINGKSVDKADKGDEVGILIKSRVRAHDTVYKV